MSSLSGWLTTKKRGRDDDQIEKDRLVALEKRRCKKKKDAATQAKDTKTNNNKKKQTVAFSNTKKKKRTSRDDDDEDSMDEFLVEDDEVEEEEDDDDHECLEEDEDEESIVEEDDSIEEDDAELSDDSKELKRKRRLGDDDDDDDGEDSSSDSDVCTFFNKYQKRTSKPPPILSQKSRAATQQSKMSKSNFFQKNNNTGTNNPYKRLAPAAKNRTTTAKKLSAVTDNKKLANTTIELVDSEDDENRKNSELRSKIVSNEKASAGTNNIDQSKKKTIVSLDDDDDDDSFESESLLFVQNNSVSLKSDALRSPPPINSDKKKSKCENKFGLEDTPEPPSKSVANNGNMNKKLKKFPKMKRFITDNDDDQICDKILANTGAASKNSKRSFTSNDYCSDEDEAIAVAWALSESLNQGNVPPDGKDHKRIDKGAKSQTKKKKQQEKQASTVKYKDDLEEYKSDNDENEGDNNNEEQDDVYVVDEDEEAASSILQTANALSAQVLQNMLSWTKRHAANDNGSKNHSPDTMDIPVGMIVDGALAISSIDANHSTDSDKNGDDDGCASWISNDLMKEILPNVKLADYQLIGINWMSLLHNMKCKVETGSGSKKKVKTTNVNGILADEMGLGKTVQTIAFLSWLHHTKGRGNGKKSREGGTSFVSAIPLDDHSDSDSIVRDNDRVNPHLIIAPASVLENWEREFQKFAPHLRVVRYHGSMDERKQLQDEMRPHLPSSTKRPHRPIHVILAPVTYFQKEKSDDRAFLRKFHLEYLVVDEAHLLKNARGTRYKTLDRFCSDHRLLLTGTPVQNSPKELMSLLCFLMPLFSRKGGSDNDFDDDQGHDGGENMLQYFVSLKKEGEDDQAAYRKLKQLFSPFVLRRRKQDVLSQILPPKERRVEFVQLDRTARALYDSVISEHVEAKKMGKKLSFENIFTQLRKAAHHPLLIRSRYRSPSEKEHLVKYFLQYGAFRGDACTKEKVAEQLEKYSDFEIHLAALDLVTENPNRHPELGRYILEEKDLFCSAKFELLRTLLPSLISKGHRILIFSGWTTVLDLLTCLMDSLDLRYMRMDGQTDVTDRQELIDTFNRDPSIPVFLLSTRASGLGITLTSAQICIMHDLDFNPFNDLQAEDRCHRIGQTKPVTVIKLVAAETVDQDVYAMQERKSKMNAAIMENESEWKKETKKEKDLIIQTALDRFMQSQIGQPKSIPAEKENGLPNSTKPIEIDTI